MKLAKSGMMVSVSTASNLGIDVDKSRIEKAIAELTRQLTQPPDAISIPKTDKTGMFVAPDAYEELYTIKVQRSRPASAPPVSAYTPGMDSTGRPSTAARAQVVDSLRGKKTECGSRWTCRRAPHRLDSSLLSSFCILFLCSVMNSLLLSACT